MTKVVCTSRRRWTDSSPGVRLFDRSLLEPLKLEKREALETPGATHLRLAVPR